MKNECFQQIDCSRKGPWEENVSNGFLVVGPSRLRVDVTPKTGVHGLLKTPEKVWVGNIWSGKWSHACISQAWPKTPGEETPAVQHVRHGCPWNSPFIPEDRHFQETVAPCSESFHNRLQSWCPVCSPRRTVISIWRVMLRPVSGMSCNLVALYFWSWWIPKNVCVVSDLAPRQHPDRFPCLASNYLALAGFVWRFVHLCSCFIKVCVCVCTCSAVRDPAPRTKNNAKDVRLCWWHIRVDSNLCVPMCIWEYLGMFFLLFS